MDNTLPPLKRIAAIHDLSGLGKCSLTVALPVISATGVECACIPTAVLSTHTGEFTGWTFRDLSDDMLPIARHWQRIGARIDGVYSGYLASPEQVGLLAQTLDCIAAPDTLVVIDPVMADNGSYYSKIDDRMCAAFRRLLSRADVITPNVTEAALLAGLATGVYGSLEETAAVWQRDLTFEPQMEGYHRAQLLAGWHKAVERARGWA